MRRFYNYSALLFGAVIASFSSLNIEAVEINHSIDTIVVTGTRQQTNIRYLPLTVNTFNRVDIENRHESSLLPMLSEQVPGLFITSRGLYGYGLSTGASGGMKIRGIGGSPTTEMMVLIDGHPLFTGLMGHTVADVYQSLLADKVEVVRGPASVLYGSNAMGGVMNIVTRKISTDGWRNNIRLSAGSYGTLTGEYSSLFRKNRFSNILAVLGGKSHGQRDNMDFNQYSVYDKIGFQLSKNWSATADININHFNSQNPGPTSAPLLDNNMHITRGMFSGGVTNDYERASGSLSYYIDWGHHRIDDGHLSTAPAKSYFFHLRDHTYGINWFETVRLFEGNHTTFGFDYQHTDGTSWNEAKVDGTRTYSANDKKSDELAGYIDSRQTIFDKLTVDAGLRYDHHSKSGSEWIPQVGLSFIASEQSTLKAIVSKGFRNPTLKELYMFASKNPELEAERMMNYELSWSQRISRLRYNLNVFYIDADNLIETTMVSGRPLNVNTGAMKNWGVETSATYDFRNYLSFDMNYSYLHTDKSITAAPRHKLYAGADYVMGNWHASTGLQWVGHLLTAVNPDYVENYVLWNMRVSYQATQWLKLFANGENLLAQKYETFRGFPMPRATVLAGVEIKL
jgi:outer membrane cobalamin receptor